VAGLEPGALDGEVAAMAVVLFAGIEKVAAAAKARCAARVADTNFWRRQGDHTSAHWVARTTGSSMAEARACVEVPPRLGQLPDTDERFTHGGLSLMQAAHITEAALADPSAEARLLAMADSEALGPLRTECRRVIAASCVNHTERHRRIRDSRCLRHYNDASGAFRLEGSFTPEAGAEILGALRPVTDELGVRARRSGERVSRDTLCADALIELCRQEPAQRVPGKPRARFVVNLRADAVAWERGHTEAGELCEIDGVGPIPVHVAQRLAEGDAFEVDPNDPDVASISTLSRHIPARLRRALLVRDPVCVVAGCYERDNLEIDHIVEHSKGGRTSIDNLCRLCRKHHRLKTNGWAFVGSGYARYLWPPRRLPKFADSS